MNDDRTHEYVPPVARDILDGQRIAAVAEAEDLILRGMAVLRERLTAMTAERNNLAEAVREVNARLVEVTAERDAWKKIAQDTRDEAREYVSELRDLSEWKRGYPRYVEELGRLDAFIAAMKDDLK